MDWSLVELALDFPFFPLLPFDGLGGVADAELSGAGALLLDALASEDGALPVLPPDGGALLAPESAEGGADPSAGLLESWVELPDCAPEAFGLELLASEAGGLAGGFGVCGFWDEF